MHRPLLMRVKSLKQLSIDFLTQHPHFWKYLLQMKRVMDLFIWTNVTNELDFLKWNSIKLDAILLRVHPVRLPLY
jgi:hypothetical protein